MGLPEFYHPKGKPVSSAENNATLSRIEQLFESRPLRVCRLKHFAEISKVIGLPEYSKKAVYEAVCRCSNLSPDSFPDISFDLFETYWNEMIKENHDHVSRFIFTLSIARTGLPSQRSYLEREDFQSILMDLIQTHPGLTFFSSCGLESMVFRYRYMEWVITKIFWDCSRAWWTGKLTAEHLRKSNLLETMHLMERGEMNLPGCFSYEQFYVVYAKFWELDEDHDMKLSRHDMENYGNGTLSDMVIERIFSDALVCHKKKVSNHQNGLPPLQTPSKQRNTETIGFKEFAAFLMAEEDKRHPTATEYWFRCLDLDGDGVISLYEMELFYSEMLKKLDQSEYEGMEFPDLVNQLYDTVSPQDRKNFTLRDIKRCGLAHRFFNPLVSREKYLQREVSDQELSTSKINDKKEQSEWEQFCAHEFKIQLIKEEIEEEEENVL